MMRVPMPVWVATTMTVALVLSTPWVAHAQSAPTEEELANQTIEDCLMWTRHDAPSLLGKNAHPLAVTAMADGTIVIVGGEWSPGAKAKAMAWTSTDGEEWDAIRLPGGKGTGATDVAVVDDVLFAVGWGAAEKAAGLVWRSDDGREWSDPLALPGAIPTGVVDTPDGIAVVGWDQKKPGQPATPTIWTSADGWDWAPTRVGRPGSWVGPLVVSPDGTSVLAATETKRKKRKSTTTLHLFRSVDGVAWDDPVLAADLSKSVRTSRGGAASYGPNGFLVAPAPKGAGGAIWQSEDGTEWQRILEPPFPISAFAEGPCGLLAFTNPGINTKGRVKKSEPVVLVSPDGTTWASTSDDAFSRAVVTDAAMTPDGRVVAVGYKDILNRVVWVGEPTTPFVGEPTDVENPAPVTD